MFYACAIVHGQPKPAKRLEAKHTIWISISVLHNRAGFRKDWNILWRSKTDCLQMGMAS